MYMCLEMKKFIVLLLFWNKQPEYTPEFHSKFKVKFVHDVSTQLSSDYLRHNPRQWKIHKLVPFTDIAVWKRVSWK